LQINVTQQGVYNLILDITTFEIDVEKVGDIQTPVYEQVKSCELYVHLSATNATYTEMTLNVDTNEYCLQKEIPQNAIIGFYSASHMARYNVTLKDTANNTVVWWDFANKNRVRVHVGGTYKIYFNAKTYEVKVELQNPDTATYFCQVEWNKGNLLTAPDSSKPYLFEHTVVAQTSVDGRTPLPKFYPELGMAYDLTIVDQDDSLIGGDEFDESGTYKLIINLKDFTLTILKQ